MRRFFAALPRWFQGRRRPQSRCGPVLRLEQLEDRTVPTVISPGANLVHPGAILPAAGAGPGGGYTPAQIRHAYGFDQILFGGVKGDGTGQTIAIVDAYDQPNIRADLAAFDSTFGIANPPSFTEVNQAGGAVLPAYNQQWGLEISLDVEWAHAIAPGAKILLVEAASNSGSDLLAALNYARNQPGVSVASLSWAASEFSGEASFDSYFTTPAGHAGITFVAASGDAGSAGGPSWPAVSPNVLAVGGTQLNADAAGNYLGETAWSGSGGGVGVYESRPGYQTGVVTQAGGARTVPDVAYDASSSSPFSVYDSSGYGGWVAVGGTSAGAPQWAALIAIADQGRALNGLGTLDGASQTLPMLYKLPSSDFHDVTSGSNGGYSAGPGYDLVTGRGTPLANLVVAGLVGPTSSSPPSFTPTTFLSVAQGRDVNGRQELFALATNGEMWTLTSDAAGNWANWQSQGLARAKAISVAADADGRAEIFAIGIDDQIYTRSQDAGGNWNWWQSQGPARAKAISVAADADGRAEIFAIGIDDQIYTRSQDAGGNWNWWQSQGPARAKAISAITDSYGRPDLFYLGLND